MTKRKRFVKAWREYAVAGFPANTDLEKAAQSAEWELYQQGGGRAVVEAKQAATNSTP